MGVGLRFVALALALVAGSAGSVVRAQLALEPPSFYLFSDGLASERDAYEARARAFLAQQGAADAQPWEAYSLLEGPTLQRSELSVFTEVEALLREGRELSARFDERSALRKLSEAEQKLLARLHLPYVHAWLAEVDLARALCAIELGEIGLAETWLARAGSLDPSRKLLAAEASPQHLVWARRLELARERRPPSQFRIQVEPRAAQVWLDDKPIPNDERELSERSGSHILRIEAPGFVPYAALVELASGRRQPLQVQLSPTPAVELQRALGNARSDAAQTRALAAAWVQRTGHPLWLFERGAEDILIYACRPACRLQAHLPAGPERVPNVDAALELRADASAQAKTSRFRPAKVWATAGAALAVGIGVALGVLLARDPAPTPERSLILDPGQLPR